MLHIYQIYSQWKIYLALKSHSNVFPNPKTDWLCDPNVILQIQDQLWIHQIHILTNIAFLYSSFIQKSSLFCREKRCLVNFNPWMCNPMSTSSCHNFYRLNQKYNQIGLLVLEKRNYTFQLSCPWEGWVMSKPFANFPSFTNFKLRILFVEDIEFIW